MYVKEVCCKLRAALRHKWSNASGRSRIVSIGICLVVLLTATAVEADISLPNLFRFRDPGGYTATYSNTGSINLDNAFFQSLGTNGRSCATCHVPGDAFGLSAADAQARYAISHGRDPLFDSFDGSTCPTGPINNSLVVKYGLIRVGITIPPNQYVPSGPQYTITAVKDPYGCAVVTSDGATTVSVYRRPLPTTNEGFLSAVQSDGRESFFHPLNNPQTYTADLTADIRSQALDAIMGHEQAAQTPSDEVLDSVVAFEMALNSAQIFDNAAKNLSGPNGAEGGPQFIASQPYYPGINDPFGGNPEGTPFNPEVFTVYSSWRDSSNPRQASIARGEQIFNTHPLTISDVPGLTTGNQKITGSCSTCHDTPNVGTHSLPVPMNIGVSDSLAHTTDPNIIAALKQLTPVPLPVFKLVCNEGPLAGRTFYTSDPGVALITGKCSDIGLTKGMGVRGLAARAPYFDNGSASSLSQLINFYNKRFQMNLTARQKQDLLHFLKAL